MGNAAAAVVRERPILFSGRLVRAILEDRKTVTRRVVKITHRTPGLAAALLPPTGIPPRPHVAAELCPYGAPGDRLWVREAWTAGLLNRRAFPDTDGWLWWHDVPAGMRSFANAASLFYRADGVEVYHPPELPGERPFDLVADWSQLTSRYPRTPSRWLPSIHMPRWASRISLEVTEVGVERLREISGVDAEAEGVPLDFPGGHHGAYKRARQEFARLWDSLNAPRGYGWDANPWVWIVRFRRVA